MVSAPERVSLAGTWMVSSLPEPRNRTGLLMSTETIIEQIPGGISAEGWGGNSIGVETLKGDGGTEV